VNEERIGIGKAWHMLAEALPPGWDIQMLLQQRGLWTAEVGPNTYGAMARYRRLTGVKAGTSKKHQKVAVQEQGESPTEALLALTERVRVSLDRRLWEFHPERDERDRPRWETELDKALGASSET